MKQISMTFSALAIFALALAPAARADVAPMHHVRGVVTKATASEISVQTATGIVIVPIGTATRIAAVVPGSAADITSGTFIGTANVPQPSAQAARALEVVVFPASMAGSGEGDYSWDLPAGTGRSSSMTNGTVQSHRGSMMTNATVTGVDNGATKVVTLAYKGGSKKVSIGPGIPIVRIMPGSKSLLASGAHVVAAPNPKGGPAIVVIVGERGAVPPM